MLSYEEYVKSLRPIDPPLLVPLISHCPEFFEKLVEEILGEEFTLVDEDTRWQLVEECPEIYKAYDVIVQNNEGRFGVIKLRADNVDYDSWDSIRIKRSMMS